MKRVLVSEEEAESLAKRERRRIEGYRRRHLKRKRSNVNDERLGALFECLQIGSFNHILYTIPFRSPLSLYLYLYLKNKAQTTKISKLFSIPVVYSKYYSYPVEVRFTKIAKDIAFTRNCVKFAYKELLKIGLILDTTEQFLPEHLSAKTCIVYNDKNIAYYDKATNKIFFSVENQSKPKVLNYGQMRSQQVDFDSVKR